MISEQELRAALHRLAPDVEEAGVWEALHNRDSSAINPTMYSARREEIAGMKILQRPKATRTRRLVSLGAAVIIVLVALGFGVNALVQHLGRDEPVVVITDDPMQPTASGTITVPTASTTLEESDVWAAREVVHQYLLAVRSSDLASFQEVVAADGDPDPTALFAQERQRLEKMGEEAYLLQVLKPLIWNGEEYLVPGAEVPSGLDHWIRADAGRRIGIEVTMMDSSVRFFRVQRTATGGWTALPVQPAAAPTTTHGVAPSNDVPQRNTPEGAVQALIAALNEHDWQRAYSLYASPEVPYDTWAAEMVQADEVYCDFALHGTTLLNDALALVRVTYRAETTPPGGERYSVVVTEPGEDWRVEKVGDLWRVGWLPRQ